MAQPTDLDLWALLSSEKTVKRMTQQLGTYVTYEDGVRQLDEIRRAAGTRRSKQLQRGIQYD